jgi:hypothetical protein
LEQPVDFRGDGLGYFQTGIAGLVLGEDTVTFRGEVSLAGRQALGRRAIRGERELITGAAGRASGHVWA